MSNFKQIPNYYTFKLLLVNHLLNDLFLYLLHELKPKIIFIYFNKAFWVFKVFENINSFFWCNGNIWILYIDSKLSHKLFCLIFMDIKEIFLFIGKNFSFSKFWKHNKYIIITIILSINLRFINYYKNLYKFLKISL